MANEGIKELTLDGSRISDIHSFYDEVNRVFMRGEDFSIGPSLDAFSDLLYGGFGAIKGNEPVKLNWLHFDKNKDDLGVDATLAFYRTKLEQPGVFNTEWAQNKLEELENGNGQTYLDILLEIIAEHPNIQLITYTA